MTRHQATTIFVLSAALFAMCSATPALADTYKILHTFKKTDGQGPKASMIFDASGKLYSTTFGGGANNNGTVFQMTHQKDGDWSESVLYSFCPSTGCADGSGPQGSLIFDTKGNLYGTTTVGGSAGGGVVFELKAGPKNTWTESVLYNFCSLTNCTDGEEPWAAVIFDASGNLYGTAKKGGANAQGVVFKLAPGAGGTWTESVLYSFCALSDCADGATPYSDLIFDASGNMYGTTFGGGTTSNSGCPSMDDRCGTVFELSPATGGTWTHQVIYSFNFTDGSDSENGVVFDTHGNLYGNTSRGGSGEGGVIYELSPAGGGTWTESVLYAFGSDGYPLGELTLDSAGNVYGTLTGHNTKGDGGVFKLSQKDGTWTETLLHNFNGSTGKSPTAGLVLDSSGNLYGAAYAGGTDNDGVVFELEP